MDERSALVGTVSFQGIYEYDKIIYCHRVYEIYEQYVHTAKSVRLCVYCQFSLDYQVSIICYRDHNDMYINV